MTIKRWDAKRDSNEKTIVAALRSSGFIVIRAEEVDLLVIKRKDIYLLEVKTRKGRLTETQKELIDCGIPIHIVRTPEEALKAVGAIK